jgi:paraquat-inducible protein B
MPEEDFSGVEVSQRSGISVFWIIPLVALVIGAWLTIQAYLDKGPLVTLYFKAATGVVANKTKVRIRDVEIGEVESVVLSDDFEGAVIKVRLTKESESMLVEGTRFWIESPRVTAGEVRGLQTLLSGVFIGIDPAKGGKSKKEFIGLDEPPFIVDENEGSYYVLLSDRRHSLNVGSPVTYRGMDAGQVVSYKMNDDGTKVVAKIFIDKPYDKYVNLNTRFWQSSGVNLSLGADGLKVHTESIVSIVAGGVSFSTPAYLGAGELAPKKHEFTLYQDQETAFEPVREKYPVLFYFNGSVRGLKVGAPVEFRGIKIGEVTSLHLQIDASDFSIKIPVMAEVEKGHFEILKEGQFEAINADQVAALKRLVDNGVRAQLKTGSLITGAIFVDFDIYEDAPPASVAIENGVIVLPTIPTALDAITSGVTTILNKIAAMPLEQIGKDLGGAVKRSRELLESNQIEDALRSLDETLKETHKLARGLNTVITPQLDAMLRELKNASRSIKSMADYLERHPEALIQGKQGGR